MTKELPFTIPAIAILALKDCPQDCNDQWTPHTLELLSDAALLAKRSNGTTVAWVFEERCLEDLYAYGCDFGLMLGSHLKDWDSEYITKSLIQAHAGDMRLILLPAGARGEEVAALLAAKLKSHWIPDALNLSCTRQDELEITAVVKGGRISRYHKVLQKNRPIVVTMEPGVAQAKKIREPGPLKTLSIEAVEFMARTRVIETLPADPKTQAIVDSRKLVAVGRGAEDVEGVNLVADFADALGASLAASRMAVDLGWVEAKRQVGQTGHVVKPDLYVACGISGASHHLAGMRDSKHIVAINNDPKAPIHDVAHLSLHGDLRALIPEITKVLDRDS